MTGPSAGLVQRTLAGMAWTTVGMAVQTVLQTAIVMTLARLLAPADFGVVSIALVVIGFAAIFGELGLVPALIQREALEPVHVRTAFTTSLLLAAAVAAVLVALGPAVGRLFDVPAVEPITRLLALSLVIRAWGAVPSALLQRAMRFRTVAVAGVVSYLVGFGLAGIPLALAGAGAWALAVAHMVQVVVHSLTVHAVCPVACRPGFDRRAFAQLIAFGSGISVARLANYLALRGDNAVVGHALGPTALGLYGPAYHLMALPADLFQRIVQSVLFPAVARLQSEPTRLAATYRRGLALTGLVALPGSGLAIMLAPEVVDVLLGPRWSGVTVPLQILATGMFFRVGYKVSVVVVKATGAVGQFALRQMPYPVMVLSFAWLGTSWGVSGVAAGVVAALAVHYVLLTSLGLRVARLTLRDYLAAHGPAVLLAVVLSGQAWIVLGFARDAHLPAWATLAVVVGSIGGTVAALVRWAPARVLGDEGLWFRHSLGAFVARRRARAGASITRP